MGHRPLRVLLCYHRCPIYGFRFNEIQGQGKVEVRNTQLARLSGFDPLDNFFRVVSSEFPRRGEPEMGLKGL